jgi:hypothetical protein
VLIRFLVRRRLPSVILTLAVWTLLSGPGNLEAVVFNGFVAAVTLFVLLRWGVVAMVVCRIALHAAWNARPLALDAWSSEGSIILVGGMILLAVYGAWAAVGGTDARDRPRDDVLTLS